MKEVNLIVKTKGEALEYLGFQLKNAEALRDRHEAELLRLLVAWRTKYYAKKNASLFSKLFNKVYVDTFNLSKYSDALYRDTRSLQDHYGWGHDEIFWQEYRYDCTLSMVAKIKDRINYINSLPDGISSGWVFEDVC